MPPPAPLLDRLGAPSSAKTTSPVISDWFAGVGHSIAAAAAWFIGLPARLSHAVVAGLKAAGMWIAHALWLVVFYLLVAAAILAAAICFGSILYLIAMRTLSYQPFHRSRRRLTAEQRRRHEDDIERDLRAYFDQAYAGQRRQQWYPAEEGYWADGVYGRQHRPGSTSHARRQESPEREGRTQGDQSVEEDRREEERRREQAEQGRRHRERKAQEARHEAATNEFSRQEAARKYAAWRHKCDLFFASNSGNIPDPPHWPCDEVGCQSPRLLKACQHSFEKLFASGGRLEEVLREELRRWHPDRAFYRQGGGRHVAVAEEITKTIGLLRSQ